MRREQEVGITAGRLARGVAAGVAASVVQAAIGKTEEIAFLPPWEDANFAPRLVSRLAGRMGVDSSATENWAIGTLFHLGYAAWWGGLYAISRERIPLRPVPGGLLLGGLIYGITFPSWGGAVQTGTERPPEQRTWRMDVVTVSVAFGFGFCTSLLYERLR